MDSVYSPKFILLFFVIGFQKGEEKGKKKGEGRGGEASEWFNKLQLSGA